MLYQSFGKAVSPQTLQVLSTAASDQIWEGPVLTDPLAGSYLPNRFVFLKWEILNDFFKELDRRPVTTPEECDRWIRDFGDLESQMHDAYQHRHALETFAPDDPVTERFDTNLNNYEAVWENARQHLYEKLLTLTPLMTDEYADHRRLKAVITNRSEHFSWHGYSYDNLTLRLERALSEFDDSIDSLVIDNNPEQISDQKLWLARQELTTQHQPEIDQLIKSLLVARNQSARVRGHEDFAAYALAGQDSIDYSPSQLRQIAIEVLEQFSPLAGQCLDARARQCGLRSIRPWNDLDQADIPYLPRLAQYQHLEAALREILTGISPLFCELFDQNRNRFLIDPYDSEQKTGDSVVLHYARMGKYLLSSGLDGGALSLTEFFHEATHLLEAVAVNAAQSYYWYRQPPPEISEGLAISMELLSTEQYQSLYKPRFSEAARARIIEDQIITIVEHARNILFESTLYLNPDEPPGRIWTELSLQASPGMNWQKLEAFQGREYLDYLHLLAEPFTGINYLLGGLISFQLHAAYQKAPEATAERMLATMQAGDSRPLPELYATLGIPFPTNPSAVSNTARYVKELLAAANESKH